MVCRYSLDQQMRVMDGLAGYTRTVMPGIRTVPAEIMVRFTYSTLKNSMMLRLGGLTGKYLRQGPGKKVHSCLIQRI